MIALIQRVSKASVAVNGQVVGRINKGLLALVGVEKLDSPATAARLVERMMGYRVFADPHGRMNLSLMDISGDLLLIPQFTLVANTNKGMRPSFSGAADPDTGQCLFHHVATLARHHDLKVEVGVFGADMQVALTNDGPVTFWLQVHVEKSNDG